MSYGQQDPAEHPGLKKFNRTWETIKHIGSKALKYGIGIGLTAAAVVGGAYVLGIAAPATLLASAGGVVDFFGTSLAPTVVNGVTNSVGAVALTALKGGVLLGLPIGALVGLSGASEAVDMKAEDTIADYERREMRQERSQMMSMQMQQQKMAMAAQAQQMEMAQNANMQLPMGRGQAPGREGGY